MPTPNINRPPDTKSRLATCLAVVNGFACGRMLTPVPIRRVSVAPAMWASAINGSTNGVSCDSGILPVLLYG